MEKRGLGMSTLEEMAADLPDMAFNGHRLVVEQILRELLLAGSFAIDLQRALRDGDVAALQHAAEATHRAAQTADVLAAKLAKDVAARRGRRCRVTP
jgi:hypothetical protein